MLNVFLFNCRYLRSISAIKTESCGIFTIFTVFHPKTLICFDAIFLIDEVLNHTKSIQMQCVFIEETPRILDKYLDAPLLDAFDELLSKNDFSEATLPKDIATKIINNAMHNNKQLITH
jgi:hypothetical protein